MDTNSFVLATRNALVGGLDKSETPAGMGSCSGGGIWALLNGLFVQGISCMNNFGNDSTDVFLWIDYYHSIDLLIDTK